MTALIESVLAGVIVSLFNRFIMTRQNNCLFHSLNHHNNRTTTNNIDMRIFRLKQLL